MDHGYDAVLRGDTLEWTGERPADWPQDESVEVQVILKAVKPRISEEERQRQLRAALDALARNQTP